MPILIAYPSNCDVLFDQLRTHVGDWDKTKYSDSLLRSSLLAGIRMLQRRWKNRYIIFNDAMLTEAPDDITIPSGYVYATVLGTATMIPSGLSADVDVVRHPLQTYTDPGPDIISQEDWHPIIIAASLILRKSQITSSAETIQSWSDGEYSFSNISSAKSYQLMYDADQKELDAYFKRRPAPVLRSNFPHIW